MTDYRIAPGQYYFTPFSTDPLVIPEIVALADDSVRIDAGARVDVLTGGTGITLTESTVRFDNFGQLYSFNNFALSAFGTGHRIVNHAGAEILGLGTSGPTLSYQGAGGQIINKGLIGSQVAGGAAVRFTDTVDTLYDNRGTAFASNLGIFADGGIDGLTIRNSDLLRSDQSTAILFGEGVTSAKVINSGQITGALNAISTQSGDIDIINRGTIGSSPDNTTQTAIEYGGSGAIVNSGTIKGTNFAIYLTDQSTGRVVNTGTIEGDVLIDGQGSVLRNEGLIDGIVGGWTGDVTIYNGGEITGFVGLGSGDDRYVAQGGGTTPWVEGRDGNDLLISADVATALLGGAGQDDLRTGAGGGTLIGGEGRDILRGGTGADTFVYHDVTDSTAAAPDVIIGFERGVDTFDFAELGVVFAFDGSEALRGGGQAWMNTTARPDGVTLWVDVDGDGAADMRMVVKGVDALDLSDLGLDPLVI